MTIRTRAGKGASLTHAEMDANIKLSVVAATSNLTLTAAHNRNRIEASGASTTITLGDIATIIAACETGDYEAVIHNADSSNAITLAPTGTDPINGVNASTTLQPGGCVHVIINSGGNGYLVIGSAFYDAYTLDGATQAHMLSRANHTGTQTLSTISDAGGAAALNVGTAAGTVAAGDHNHSGVYSLTSHNHDGTYEPAFSKNTGFNKNLGTTSGTVSEGNHTHAALATIKVKTADETVVSSTTLQDDDHLTGWSLTAGKHYRVKGIIYSGHFSGIDADISLTFTNAVQNSLISYNRRASSFAANTNNSSATTGMTLTLDNLASGFFAAMAIDASFQANATTGGTMKLQWAQNSSDANPVYFKEGSWLEVTQLD